MERIIVYTEPTNQKTEAYRTFCTNLMACLSEGKKVIEIASATERKTASIVTGNLAVAMAQAGTRVLLIDCNLHAPQQHEIFTLQNSGLTDCLMNGQDLCSYVQSTRQANLFVLPSGSSVTNPVEVLLSKPMQELLNMAKAEYDIILLDVPPTEKVADATALGTKTDGVVLIFTNKVDKVHQAQKAKEMFKQAGVPVLGCILDKA